MRKIRTAITGSLFCIFLLLLCTGTVSAADSQTATGQVIITGYELDPKVFYPDDVGILTVKLKNVGTVPVNIGRPALLGGEFLYLNGKEMVPVGQLGAGGETSVSLQIKPNSIKSGMAYPYFSVDYATEGGAVSSTPVRLQVPIQIDNSDLTIQLIEKPNMVSAGSMGTYKLRIGNPRNSDITGLTISIGGENIATRQEGFFIGTLKANNYTDITVDLSVQTSSGYRDYSGGSDYGIDYSTYSSAEPQYKMVADSDAISRVASVDVAMVDIMPMPVPEGNYGNGGSMIIGGEIGGSTGSESGDATLIVTAEYRNGQNQHTSEMRIPITATGSSSVVISDLIATKYENKYTVTGTVYNPGLRDISSVIVVAGQPAIPQGSYQAALGVVEGNDYGEFELSFTVRGEPSSIPIIVTYQDELGMYHQEQNSVSIIDYDLAPEDEPTPGQASVLVPAFVAVGAAALGAVYRARKE